MIDFFNIVSDKELEDKLALTDSDDVVRYIYNLGPDKQEVFFQRLEKLFGYVYITITREAVRYLGEVSTN